MKKIIGILLVLGMMSCSTSKIKIGDYTYQVKYKKINTWELVRGPRGEFGVPGDLSTFKWVEKGDSLPIVLTKKELYLNNERVLGCEVKAQKLTLMSKADSVYLKGKMVIVGNLLICVQQRLNNYLNNSVRIQVMEQQKDGSFRFKKYLVIPADEYVKER